MICSVCGKKLDDGAYISLDNWLQWEHYSKQMEPDRYCSKECFADDWMVEWVDADDLGGDAS